MRLRTCCWVATVVVIALVVAACGPLAGSRGAIVHPRGGDDLVLRVDRGGGYWSDLASELAQVPDFLLTGDGRVITRRPMGDDEPAPQVPELVVRRVSEDGVQAILRAARDAGIWGPDRHHGESPVQDAANTAFTLVAGGQRHFVTAYALGVDKERGARARLHDLVEKLSELESWLPPGSLGGQEPYPPPALRVVIVLPRSDVRDGDRAQPEIRRRWPLITPAGAFGASSGRVPGGLFGGRWVRCGVVTGQDMEALLREAERGGPGGGDWESEGEPVTVLLRPLLPDERGCERPTFLARKRTP